MSTKKEQLRELVEKGLITDIKKMEKNYLLITTITSKGSDIDAPGAGNFGDLFRVLQNGCLTETILATSRLYEKQNSRYPTLCIQSLLDFIENNAGDLTPLTQQPNLKRHLTLIGAPEYLIELVDKDEIEYGKQMVKYFRDVCFSIENKNIIEKLKNIRDKRTAHNENTTFISKPILPELKKLITDAKKLAGIIGWGYLSMVYIYEDRYFLSDDAKRTSIALERLFKKLNI